LSTCFPSGIANDASLLNAVRWQQEFDIRDQTHSTAPSFRWTNVMQQSANSSNIHNCTTQL